MSVAPFRERPLEALADAELIECFRRRRSGDERPFAELFRRHRQLVWRVAMGYFGSPQDADDMTQEVFFTAYRKLDQFRGEASFRTWIHRIAANRCKNEIRRRSRRPRPAGASLEIAAATIADDAPGPEAAAAARRAVGRLAGALATLDARDRQILELVDIEQIAYRDVAAELGLTLGAVKMRVLRARSRLLEAYRDLGGNHA